MHLMILTWLHILCMIGAFGVLAGAQFGLPSDVRNREDVARGISKIGNIFIGIGLLASVAFYGMAKAHTFGAHYNGVIGTKFVLLLAVGALLGMSKKPGKGDTFRTVALVLIAVAALLGKVFLKTAA
jgi:hypothetical protein